ncbi:MAG: ABC transporter permease [Flavobacteriaceae bacterium]|jgi:putative ABC transport system permease protein|nr:ABC transporter permease [Flavobacteriaceae bacterium]MBT4112436.1 ABC transporter permease [Flavobacteriaceae bacterium]MBT4614290.1 ABC transporter permease [Flavobacteriaceae bacterium]MBT5246743.1 ABC transporter permease [Flavobacteriaceae bacterium]MBT5649928.1 ABC transporter permease [Flavobacteriaceae bacterium]
MILKIAWRNIWRNKKRTLITTLSISGALFLIILMRSMQFGFYDNIINTIVQSYSGYVQVHANGYWDKQSVNNSMEVDEKFINEINSIDGIDNIAKRLQTFSLVSKGEKSKGVIITGIEIEKEQLITDWDKRIIEGSKSFDNADRIILSKGIAEYFDVTMGDTLVLFGQGYQGMMAAGKYVANGIIDLKNPKLNENAIFMDIESAQDYISSENIATHLVIDKKEYYDEKKIAEDVRKAISSDYEVMTWKEILPELDQMITADNVGGLIMAFILYVIVCFGMFGTVLMMTEERMYELGVLLSIGMDKIKLYLIILLETIMLSSIGVIIGVLTTRPISHYFNKNPINMDSFGEGLGDAMGEFGFDPIMPFSINWDIPISHAAFIFGISLLISIYPAIRILSLNPVKAMKK